MAFWTGMTLLPVFWVWWLPLKKFNALQRRGARIWALVYCCLIAITAPWLLDRYSAVWDARLWVLHSVTAGLGAILLCRIFTFIELFVFVDVVAFLAAQDGSWWLPSAPTANGLLNALGWLAGAAILNLVVKSHWTRDVDEDEDD